MDTTTLLLVTVLVFASGVVIDGLAHLFIVALRSAVGGGPRHRRVRPS